MIPEGYLAIVACLGYALLLATVAHKMRGGVLPVLAAAALTVVLALMPLLLPVRADWLLATVPATVLVFPMLWFCLDRTMNRAVR